MIEKYLVKKLQELNNVVIDEETLKKYERDNVFLEESLKNPEVSPKEIEKEFLRGKYPKIDPIRFTRIFRIDSPIKRKKIISERDKLLNLFLSSSFEQKVEEMKNSNVTSKVFLLELGERVPELKEILKNILKRVNMKEASEIVKTLFEIKEQMKEKVEEKSLIDFFKELNSRKTDFLLDKLFFLVKELENDSNKQKELFLLKNLFNYFRSLGVRPIKKDEKNLLVSLKDIEDGEYLGESFKENELKKVNIERLGWRYRNIQISPVLYREVKKEDK